MFVSTASQIMKVLMDIFFGVVILSINMIFEMFNDFPCPWVKGQYESRL
jgi:hypothetical protein